MVAINECPEPNSTTRRSAAMAPAPHFATLLMVSNWVSSIWLNTLRKALKNWLAPILISFQAVKMMYTTICIQDSETRGIMLFKKYHFAQYPGYAILIVGWRNQVASGFHLPRGVAHRYCHSRDFKHADIVVAVTDNQNAL